MKGPNERLEEAEITRQTLEERYNFLINKKIDDFSAISLQHMDLKELPNIQMIYEVEKMNLSHNKIVILNLTNYLKIKVLVATKNSNILGVFY